MRKLIVASFAVLAVGCASSAELRYKADVHRQKAEVYQARADYVRANEQLTAAYNLQRKAEKRARDEARAQRYWY